MNVIYSTADLNPGLRKVCVAIGVFDGVHLGHQQVIRQAVSDALQHDGVAVVITFDRHPNTVVAPARAPAMIYPLEKRLEVIASLGVHATCLVHFDLAYSKIPGEQFVRGLAANFKSIQSLCVGSDFTFGYRRSGNLELLKSLGREFKFDVHGVASLSLNDCVVSSTRIRDAIHAGQFYEAGEMLGRPYSLCGPVIQGDRLGRTFGFPTANIDVAGLVVPPSGVYAAHVIVGGATHRAVVNLGTRPTLQSPEPRFQVEAHLLDFDADIYGQTIELDFIDKLRDERKFPSLDALKEQIRMDISAAGGLFSSNEPSK
jgi:riboflavin kinase/FMN adenylyltransferase